MPTSTSILPAGLAVAYGLLGVIFAGRNRDQPSAARSRRWMILTLVAALAGAALYALPDDAHTDAQYEALFIGELTQPALAVIAINLMLVLFGGLTLRYLQYRATTLWTGAGLLWWAGQAVLALTTSDTLIGQDSWLSSIYDPVDLPGVVAVGGWLVIGVLLLLLAFYSFYKARLSEIANQALFWVILIPLVVMGAVLGASGSDVLAEAGWVTQFVGLVAAVYSVSAYRVFDIRRTSRRVAATAILTVITALVVFETLVIAHEIDTDTDGIYVILGGLALATAVVYIPVRFITEGVTARFFGASTERIAQRLRQFSEDITGVVELDALVEVTMNTLSQTLRVRRGGLILVSEDTGKNLLIEPVQRGMGEMPEIKGQLTNSSPVYKHLLHSRTALLQYDLDYGRVFADVPPEERAFFQQMRMSAYAPVVVQGHLIGILCCGPKASDDPFTESDLELLITIANQAGVALRNARLVADLRRRETEQAELNLALSDTTEQLEKLDGVKTDFITIASHELRTPLAQIRGYTDIMEAMNEQGMLDQDQAASMTSNLRKAADRLEELIGAMLDVSQLDVDAMDLRFTQTSVENAMRMAIEPLTESIKSRRLMLSARGLRDLPPIQADMQRLVQAFRNVVLNAIKYTPDGGRIDISGRMQDDEILIKIKDSGIGIDSSNHELIFQKFFRAHDPSLHSTGATKFMGAGPGLGLTIAKGVVDGHGGRIWVESEGYDPELYPGTTVYITLPLSPPEDAKRVLPFEGGLGFDIDGGFPQPSIPDLSPTIVRRPEGLNLDD